MKKLITILLVLILLPMHAIAADIDFTAFENKDGIKYTYDDMADSHKAVSSLDFVELLSAMKGAVEPAIVTIKSGDTLIMVFGLNLSRLSTKINDPLNGYIVKIGDDRYSGDFVSTNSDSASGVYLDKGTIICGENGLAMIKHISDSESVKVRLIAENENVDFDMTGAQIGAVKTLYDAYIASGAADQDFTLINALDSCKKQ